MRTAPALLSLSLAGLLAAGCHSMPPPAARAMPVPSPSSALPALEDAGIDALAEGMAAGRFDSVSLTRAYLARIQALDRAGPTLRAVVATNPQALADAAALDAERRAGRVRGPLHGIPVLLKDNIDATPMATTAGSLALLAHRPARDAFLVERLRAAGVVVLGKANLSEWANFRSSRSISGWSGVGGQTRNAHVLDRNPCGSSSGSAVAAAAALAAATVGTETDGSIICPAAVNGVVGIKPTLGRVSRQGVVPIASAQDTAGPMARSLRDAVLLLDAMSAADPRDAATTAKDARFPALAPHLNRRRWTRPVIWGRTSAMSEGVVRPASSRSSAVVCAFRVTTETGIAAAAPAAMGLPAGGASEPQAARATASASGRARRGRRDMDGSEGVDRAHRMNEHSR